LRTFIKWAFVVIVIYACLTCALLAVMYQPPRTFGRIMAHVPEAAFMVLPFKQLWFVARKGSLSVGDPAPDFSLWTVDRKSRVQLSAFQGQKPVVLIFGSYT
jgi:hypothetical protein